MKSIYSLWFVATLFLSCGIQKTEQSNTKARAVDDDAKNSLIKVTDGDVVYPVILTGFRNELNPASNLSKRGYRLRCDRSEGLNDLLKVFGYDISQYLALTDTYREEDGLVLNAQVSQNPVLNCLSTNESTLLKLKLANGTYQYYLDFGKKISGKNIYHMAGCQELITALGHDPRNAQEITPFTIASFANNSDEYDLNCNIKDRIEWQTETGNIFYLELNVNAEAGSFITPIKLLAKAKNAPSLRLEYSIVSNSCGNTISLDSQNQIVGRIDPDFMAAKCELEISAKVVNLENQYRAAQAKITFDLGEYLGAIEWQTPSGTVRQWESVLYARSVHDSDPYKITAVVRNQPSVVVSYRLFSNTCGDLVKLDTFQGIISTKKVADDFRGCEIVVDAFVTNLERNYRSARARIAVVKSWEDISIGDLVIPEGVTAIQDEAFTSRELTKVVIPNSVESIGSDAFADNLFTEIVIPNSVTYIGEAAFLQNQIAKITLSENIKTIEPYAFADNRLTTVKIPNSVIEIKYSAFSNNQIASISFPNGLLKIEREAFVKNRLVTINIPGSVNSIGTNAFAENQLVSIYIPDSINIIESGTFQHNKLTNVTIPNSVVEIKNWAFDSNQIAHLTIPSSVKKISGFGSNKLTQLNILNGVEAIESFAFNKNLLQSIVLPNSVSEIGLFSFANNRLTSVNIPSKVTTIGHGAFSDNQLVSIKFPDSLTKIDDQAFRRNQLSNINIPHGVTEIGIRSFEYNKLTSITIPNSVTKIGVGAFNKNPINQVTIGANVKVFYDLFEIVDSTTVPESERIYYMIDDKFDFYYQIKGKKAGTYKLVNSEWTGPF